MTPNSKSKIQNLKSRRRRRPVCDLELGAWNFRRQRRRRGIVLLLVISLLALFILLGVTFTIVSLQALNASKLESKQQQYGDNPETEMDLVLGQILYDTQARTVLQYHSLLRDLYGYDGRDPFRGDGENMLQPFSFNNTPQPQFRESFQGNVIPPQVVNATTITSPVLPQAVTMPQVTAAGGQLHTFLFALPPFPFANPPLPQTPVIQPANLPIDPVTTPLSGNFRWNALTALSAIPNYYVGRVITFTSGAAANHSARIVAYNPVPGNSQHRPVPGTQLLVNGATVLFPYLPAYGQFTIEMIESKRFGQVFPNPGDSFIVNGAPFNGAGAGHDPITGNIDAALVSKAAIQTAANNGTAVMAGVTPALNEYVALLPNYASYDSATRATVFSPTTQFDARTLSSSNPPPGPHWIDPNALLGNKARAPNSMAIGGMDESWDAPDFQNMFLAMVPPRVAENHFDAPTANNLPIIPSFHRPELVNYWFQWVKTNILEPPSLNHLIVDPAQQAQIFLYPLGADGKAATGDEPAFGSPNPLTPQELDRIHMISRGCMFRPLPGDHPSFTGSNSTFAAATAQQQLNLLRGFDVTGNFYQNAFDVDNDNDGVPDSVWIDAGLPIVTMPDGRRVKRMAAILIKDLDGLININAQGNAAQVYTPDGGQTYPHLATTGLQRTMVNNNYQPLPFPVNPNTSQPLYYYSAGLALGQQDGSPGQLLPRGMGFGPAEVCFANIFNNNAAAYQNVIFGRYVSNRVTNPYVAPDGTISAGTTILDSLLIDQTAGGIKRTGLPFAGPGLPYHRDGLSVIKHSGVPNDHTNLANLPTNVWRLVPDWYNSPPDVWGRSAVVLDVGGHPMMTMAAGGHLPLAVGGFPRTFTGQIPEEMVDSPYEICLSGEDNGTDSPYTVAELERLLRYHDSDASQLPPRLLNLASAVLAPGYPTYLAAGSQPPGTIGTSQHIRNMLTSHSSHLPVPSMRAPQEVRAIPELATFLPAMGSTSILDLYAAKLQRGGVPPANLAAAMQVIVPWEFFKGQKFDINRWLGDGVDNDNNGVPDDLSDMFQTNLNREYAFRDDDLANDGNPDFPNFTPPASFRRQIAAHTNGLGMADSYAAKQAYARHLFCLAMLFLPDDPANPGGALLAPNFSSYDADATTPTANRRLMIRRIAQWAINCVDFRDKDQAMTPFEYDENPWDGWSVDGFIGRSPGPDGGWGRRGFDDNGNGVIDDRFEFSTVSPSDDIDSPGDDLTAPGRALVWGLEEPGLLLTETLAFHDRGIKDTRFDSGVQKTVDRSKNPTQMAPDDPDLDQFRVPKGSVFLELYCPRPNIWNNEPTNFKPTYGSVNLASLAPQDASGNRRPVWRMAFSRLMAVEPDPNNPVHPARRALTRPESMAIDPIVFNTANAKWEANMSAVNTTAKLEIDRFAYFTNNNFVPPSELNASFYNYSIPIGDPNPTLFLNPGRYALVGPRPLTYLGSQNPDPNTSPDPTPPANSLWGGNSKQYISMSGNSVVVTKTDGNTVSRTPATDAQTPLTIICDTDAPTVWGVPPTRRVGMNISEPLPSGTYYPVPTLTPPADPSTTDLATGTPGPRATLADFYGDPDVPGNSFPDLPIESDATRTTWPIVANQMQGTGTYVDCSSVLLQRLADPDLPYNPSDITDLSYNPALPVNPYITVDWSTIDLTVFSGEEDATSAAYSPSGTPQDFRDTNNLAFRSRQRGFLTNGGGLTSNPWPPLTLNTTQTPLVNYTRPTYFGIDLANRLTNPVTRPVDLPAMQSWTPHQNYGAYVFQPMDATTPELPADSQTLGSLNSTVDFPVNSNIGGFYYGEPIVPFPWLTWNKRPFTNAMELLLVPSSSAERLALEMTPDFPVLPGSAVTPLTTPSPYSVLPPSAPADGRSWHWPFGHLLNLFYDSQIDTTDRTTALSSSGKAPHLFRLLEYVEAPSPYVGTERWYNPNWFQGVGLYQPPFNKLSRFRDPGRININTIFDSDIWDALVGQFPGLRASDNFAQQFFLSRQGYGTNPNEIYLINDQEPTRFGNPFRAADSADLVPNVSSLRKGFPITATLLRPDPTTIATSPQPLFHINATNALVAQWKPASAQQPGRNAVPGIPGSQANAHDINRNPYFRYQPLQKIGNIVTTNSNCFAVWITIGYFEVEENRPTTGPMANQIVYDAAHPDGYALGQEAGIDSGHVTRHRAFFVIDRSIPVGFSPGSRLNTDECVLIRRLIE